MYPAKPVERGKKPAGVVEDFGNQVGVISVGCFEFGAHFKKCSAKTPRIVVNTRAATHFRFAARESTLSF